MKRLFAILAFLGSYLGVAALLYAASFALQSPNAPSILVIPLIGVALATMPANAGFAIGVLFWGRNYSVWQCVTCGVLVAVGIAAVAYPIGNSPAIVINTAFAAVFVICVCLPRVTKVRAGIKNER